MSLAGVRHGGIGLSDPCTLFIPERLFRVGQSGYCVASQNLISFGLNDGLFGQSLGSIRLVLRPLSQIVHRRCLSIQLSGLPTIDAIHPVQSIVGVHYFLPLEKSDSSYDAGEKYYEPRSPDSLLCRFYFGFFLLILSYFLIALMLKIIDEGLPIIAKAFLLVGARSCSIIRVFQGLNLMFR